MIIQHSRFNFLPIVTGLAIASGMATITTPALAQQSSVLEEIIVTARKMYEPLQSVPVAVSAFSGEAIDNLVMRDIREIEGFVPNLVIDSVTVSPAGASIYIRGVGTQEVERALTPPLASLSTACPCLS
jgi:iron complex outermembrane receptor protein